MPAHAVADDQQGVESRLVPPDDHRVFILLTFEARICRPGDTQTQGLRTESREMNRVLTDGDAVVVVELFLLHWLAVH